MKMAARPDRDQHPILLYDGVCGLCNGFVQFTLRHDPRGIFRFAALQSEFGRHVLQCQGISAEDLDTVYIVLNHDAQGSGSEVLLARSDAVSYVLLELGAAWRIAGRLLRLLPRSLRDWGYRIVARNRYRV